MSKAIPSPQASPAEANHHRVEKPWGYELIWAKTQHYAAKILVINAGHSLSLQYHQNKEETMFFEAGECLVETGPDEAHLTRFTFSAGSVFHIPPGTIHRLTAKTDCRIFEVSTPQLEDVVRLKDRYGRT